MAAKTPAPSKQTDLKIAAPIEKKETVATDFERLSEHCRRGVKDAVAEMTSKNPKLVTEKGTVGNTALHWAAMSGHADVCEVLIKAKANINAQNDAKETPLHLVAWKNQLEVAHLLVKNKADRTIKNKDNKTAAQLVTQAEMRKVLPEFDDAELGKMVKIANDDDDGDDEDW